MPDQTVQHQLIAWFTANDGYLNPSLDLAYTKESGQHFTATAAISASPDSSAPLCKCPFSLTLSHLNILTSPPRSIRSHAQSSACRHLLSGGGESLPKAAMSYFFLCEQRLRGQESFWFPYIEALPREDAMSTPWWFDGEDMKWLLGTSIHVSPEPERSGVEMRRLMWKGWWERGVAVLKAAGEGTERYTW